MDDKDPRPFADRRKSLTWPGRGKRYRPDVRTQPVAQPFDGQVEVDGISILLGKQVLLEKRERATRVSRRDVEMRQLLELDELMPIGAIVWPGEEVGRDKIGKLTPPPSPRRGVAAPIDDEVRTIDELEGLRADMAQRTGARHPQFEPMVANADLDQPPGRDPARGAAVTGASPVDQRVDIKDRPYRHTN